MHLIAKHVFPQDYDFFVVNDGIDRRSSMLRSARHRRRSSAALSATENIMLQSGKDEIAEHREKRKLSEESDDDMPQVKVVDTRSKGARQEAAFAKKDDAMDDLVGGMSALKFIPPSVQFGRGRGKARGGFSKT